MRRRPTRSTLIPYRTLLRPGEEALARARDEDRPILVSIGYSACHWCHVMERECFEDEAIAALMNEHFVCVKVDREERPDVDAIYMDARSEEHTSELQSRQYLVCRLLL